MVCPAYIKISQKGHFFERNLCVACGKCEKICLGEALKFYGKEMTVDELLPILLEDKDFYETSGGGVTFSGGEPLMQVDLCVEIAKLLKENNINIAIDTSGFVPRETLEKIIPYTDTFLFDIKAIDEKVHIDCTGVSNKTILENIKYIDGLGIPVEIRYPYIPSMNDSEAEKIAEFVKELKSVKTMRILPYHNYAESKYDSLEMKYPVPDILPPSGDEILSVSQKVQKICLKNVVPY